MEALRRIVGVSLVIAVAVAPLGSPAQPGAEQKFEGRVLHTKVTLCEHRARGCAGYMILETDLRGRRERVMVQVRLGVPIRHGDDYVYLASLGGKLVSVIHVTEKGAIVARAIQVLDGTAR